MRILLASLVLCLAMPLAAHSQDKERFQLFNHCKPVFVQLSAIGVSEIVEQRVQNLIESRFRAARLYSDTHHQTFLRVTIAGPLPSHSSVGFLFFKPMRDLISNEISVDSVWGHTLYGCDHASMDDMISDVSRLTDKFIAAYLRVNSEACKGR